ncbi:MAG: kelch repeat-containing protein [Maribacter sp.]
MKPFKKICTMILAVSLVISCKKDDGIDQPLIIAEIPEPQPDPESENGAPTLAVLTLPTHEATLQSTEPHIEWEAAIDPENELLTYHLFLGKEGTILSPIAENLETTTFEITSNLEKGIAYSWFVETNDINGNSSKSETFNFTTEHIDVTLVTENAAFSKRSFSSTTVFNDKIWVIGGKDESDNVLSDIWSSTDGLNWTLVTDVAPFGPINAQSVIVFNNKMWMYSGSNGVILNNKIWSSEDGINWVQETNDSMWNTVPFYGQNATTMFVFDDKIWRFAAYFGSIGDLTEERYIWNSSDGRNWTLVSENHGFDKKYGMEVIPFKNKLIGIEGSNFNSEKFTKIWESSNGIDWEVIAEDLPFNFGSYTEAQVLNDKLYITAGSGYDELWFTEDGSNWQKATAEKKYPLRYANHSVKFNNKIYIVGGGSHTDSYNDVWVIE